MKPNIHRRLFSALLGALILAGTGGYSAETERTAEIVSLHGTLEYRKFDSKDWKPAAPKQKLANGDRVRTGAKSKGVIRLANGNVLRLVELTTLEIRPPQTTGGKN